MDQDYRHVYVEISQRCICLHTIKLNRVLRLKVSLLPGLCILVFTQNIQLLPASQLYPTVLINNNFFCPPVVFCSLFRRWQHFLAIPLHSLSPNTSSASHVVYYCEVKHFILLICNIPFNCLCLLIPNMFLL
jgi:hypothetical protein